MALSIGEYNQRLLTQINKNKELYKQMAKGTPIEYELNKLYTNLTIAFRDYANSITSVVLPTQSKPTTNIYLQNNKVIGVDHRDYEKEYWDNKRIESENNKPIAERRLLIALREIDEALNSVPEIKAYREKNPPPPLEQPKTISSSTGGCYVATCIYGSYDCPQVWTLRRYRDYVLGSTWYGRLFIYMYYAISPTIVKLFGKTNFFKRFWKVKLDRMVSRLQAKGVKDTYYEDKKWR